MIETYLTVALCFCSLWMICNVAAWTWKNRRKR
jgi:hypothetical protein